MTTKDKNIRLVSSATQVNEFCTCKRRWVAGYLLGLKEPQNEAMAFGTAGHKDLELYMKTGKVPDETKPWQFTKDSPVRYPGLSAKKALKHIPNPKTARPEHGFEFTIKGIKFIGYIDLEWQDENGLWVTDYKFTSSFQNALKEDTLAANVQATIYSIKALLEHKVQEVNLKWIYILSTKKPSARPVISKLTEKQTKEQLRGLLQISEEMIELKAKVTEQKQEYILKSETLWLNNGTDEIINSIPPTVASCPRYGGCYYTDRCKLTEDQLMKGDMEDMDNDINSKLKDMGFDQFIKAEPVEEAAQETKGEKKQHTQEDLEKMSKAKEKGAAAGAKLAQQVNIDDFLKEPTTHTDQPKEKRGKVDVQLNAPEHYVEEQTVGAFTQAIEKIDKLTKEENVKTSCCGGFSLTDEEKKVLKGLIDRL